MTEPENATLEFLARQLERVLSGLGAIEEQVTVLTGMMTRLDRALRELTTEVRGLAQALSGPDYRSRGEADDRV